MTQYVIVTTQRSGSTLLVDFLSSHPRVLCLGEIFLEKNKRDFAYRQYRNESLGHKIGHWLLRSHQVDDYLSKTLSPRDDLDALGFKLMYYQGDQMPQIVTWIKRHNLKVIHLIRTNMLRNMVSRAVARARGLYHSDRPVELTRVQLKPAELKRKMDRMARTIERYRRSLAGGHYTELTYEELVANKEAETHRILRFLGVDAEVSLSSHRVKLNPYPLSQVIENYGEIAEMLRGTVYEKYLED